MTTTTAIVPSSSVLSMPSNASAESAAKPAGPVTYASSPSAPAVAVSVMAVTSSAALFQPSGPRLSGTRIWAACPSAEGTGPTTSPSRLGFRANTAASALTFSRSAGVRPDGRS
jgi:hypothetical protein